MKKRHLFLWNNRLYTKFYIISNIDIHAGFCALMLYVLNGIRKASDLNAIPVVDFNRHNTPEFYNKKHGESIWEYFFEPVSLYTAKGVQSFLEKGLIDTHAIYTPTATEVMRMHHDEDERLATFWAKKIPADKAQWLAQKRMLGREYVKNYIRVKQNILEKVNNFTATYFKAYYMVGVHIRGTDFAYASPTGIKTYFEEIDTILRQNSNKQCLIFLATDQKQYVEAFKSKYRDKVLCTNAVRSENHIAPFRLTFADAYQKGEDVLVDILILSKCNHVIKGAAAVGEMALWFNRNISISDFSIESEFYQKPYYELEAAFSKLNIGQKNTWQLEVHRFKLALIRKIQDSIIGKKLYIKFKFVRKLLKH